MCHLCYLSSLLLLPFTTIAAFFVTTAKVIFLVNILVNKPLVKTRFNGFFVSVVFVILICVTYVTSGHSFYHMSPPLMLLLLISSDENYYQFKNA